MAQGRGWLAVREVTFGPCPNQQMVMQMMGRNI